MDKCFCHLNGYEVKDAKARKMLNGKMGMGNIKVGGISSKNLFNKYGNFNYGNGINATTLLSNGQIQTTANYSTSRSNGQLIENLLKNTNYTLSGTIISSLGDRINNVVIEILCSDGSTLIKQLLISNDKTKPYDFSFTFNTGDNTSICLSFSGWKNTSESSTVVFDNIQLEIGSIATEYAPYFEIPTMDYINGTKSMGDIKVSSVKSKNLFDESKINKNIAIMVGDGATSTSNYSHTSDYIEVKANKTYILTFNYDTLLNSAERGICYYNSNKEFLKGRTYNLLIKQAIILPTEDGYIRFTYDKNCYDIQIEEGIATEYTPYFELATTDYVDERVNTGGGSKGFYYVEMPIKKILVAEDSTYPITISDIETHEKFAELIEKIVSDNVLKPYVVIANNLTSYTDENSELVENPFPRELILVNYSTFEGDGVTHYSFNGTCDVQGFVDYNNVNLPRYEDVHVDIDGVWSDDKFEISTLSISINRTQLVTKKYLEDNAGKQAVFEVTCTPKTTDGKTTYKGYIRVSDEYTLAETYFMGVNLVKLNTFTKDYYSIANDYQNIKFSYGSVNGEFTISFEKIEGTSTEDVIARVILGKY